MLDWLLCIPALCGLLFFILVLALEPRSLLSGAAVMAAVGGVGLTIVLLLFSHSQQLAQHPLILTVLLVLAGAIMVFLLAFPFLLSLLFLIEGIRLIRKEGLSPANCLSIGFSIFIFLVVFIFPVIMVKIDSPLIHFLYLLASTVVGYFSLLLALYITSSLINLVHLRKAHKFDQIVVLGSGLFGEKVPPLLASRIEAGIALQKKNPNAILILSGGQGPGETVPEGFAMKQYALTHGADPARTISEEQSKTTRENLMYSYQLFPEPGGRTAIVTTRYHVFRALLFARELKIKARGYGSRTKWYFTLNALLREFAAYLSITRKRQLKIVCILLAPELIFGLIGLIFN